MKTYQIFWTATRGISYVKANSKKDAIKKANEGKDTDYEEIFEYDLEVADVLEFKED